MRPLNLILVVICAHSSISEDIRIGRTTPDIIASWGYPVEEVNVTTSDGYILTMHRIPHGIRERTANQKRPVVFLQHGLDASSSNFVTNLPTKSLAYLLADRGYDVWMGNFRGNLYSKSHIEFNTQQTQFWNFTWTEMCKYDLSAMIDKSLEMTNQSYVYYVGHSQGTLTMFAKLASEPEFNKKIKKFFALAPVGTVKHIRGLLSSLAHNKFFITTWEFLFGTKEFTPDNGLMKGLEKGLCQKPLRADTCANFVFMMTGPDKSQLNMTRLPMYLTDMPAGTSTHNILHWTQMINQGKLQDFDYKSKNMKMYGKSTPRSYDLKNVKADTFLFWSKADWLADEEDIKATLLTNLTEPVLIRSIELENFNHMDFLWGERAPSEVYGPIVGIIREDVRKSAGQKSTDCSRNSR